MSNQEKWKLRLLILAFLERRFSIFQTNIYEFTGVSPFASLNLPFFKDVEVAAYSNFLLVSVVTGDTFGLQNKTIVYKVYQNATVEYLQLLDPVNLAVKTTAIFKNKGEVQLALAGDTGVYIFEYQHADGQFNQIQQISASNVFLVEQVVLREQTFMMVGLTGSENMTSGPDSSFALYRWEGGHFDNFFEYSVPYLSDLCPFRIHSHYLLAVAVHDPSNVEYPDLSMIMRYDHHTDAFVLDQYITTHGARDWEFFDISEEKDQEHFLVLASDRKDESGNEKSIIYKYIWHKFVPFQCISTKGAKKWQVITRGTDVLVVLSSSNGIDFFQYDGWRFSLVTISPIDETLKRPVESFSSAKVNDTDFLAVASTVPLNDSSSYTIFEVVFNQTNPLSDFHTILEEACKSEISNLEEIWVQLSRMRVFFSDFVYVNTNETQIIKGNITFTGSVRADEADIFGELSAENGHIFNASEAKQFEEMQEQVADQAESIDWLEIRVNNTMKRVGDTQVVTAEKTFKHLTSSSTFKAGAIIVTSDLVNGYINITDLDGNVFMKNKNATVQAPFILNGSLIAEDDMQVNGYIDGVLPADLVSLQGNHTIGRFKVFQDSTNFTANLDVQGLVDGVDISEDTVLLTSTNQTVTGALTFNEAVRFEGDVAVDGLVDGIDISELVNIAVFKNQSYIIQGEKTFATNVSSTWGLSVESGKTIDGVDVEDLDRYALKISEEQNITGHYTFDGDIQIDGNVSVEGTVNNLYLPNDILLVNSSEEFTIFGPITFTRNLTVLDLNVGQAIDGIEASDGGSNLDVLLLSPPSNGDQIVSGNITFMDDIHLKQDTPADGLVDGVDLSELSLETVRKDEDSIITGFKIFQDHVNFLQDIQLEGTLSDVNITDVDARALKTSDDAWSAIGELVFTAPVTNFEANLETISQHSFRDTSLADLALQGVEETINGQKAFQTISSEKSINFTDHLNGISLDKICEEAILLNGTDAVIFSGSIIFQDELQILGDMNLNGTIDGLDLKDAVTVFGTQVISSITEFHSPVFVDDFNVNGDVEISGNVNGDNVAEIVQDTLFIYGDQTVSGNKTFINDLTFGGDLDLNGSINEVDISDLALDAVYKIGDYTISGGKVFTSEVGMDDITVGVRPVVKSCSPVLSAVKSSNLGLHHISKPRFPALTPSDTIDSEMATPITYITETYDFLVTDLGSTPITSAALGDEAETEIATPTIYISETQLATDLDSIPISAAALNDAVATNIVMPSIYIAGTEFVTDFGITATNAEIATQSIFMTETDLATDLGSIPITAAALRDAIEKDIATPNVYIAETEFVTDFGITPVNVAASRSATDAEIATPSIFMTETDLVTDLGSIPITASAPRDAMETEIATPNIYIAETEFVTDFGNTPINLAALGSATDAEIATPSIFMTETDLVTDLGSIPITASASMDAMETEIAIPGIYISETEFVTDFGSTPITAPTLGDVTEAEIAPPGTLIPEMDLVTNQDLLSLKASARTCVDSVSGNVGPEAPTGFINGANFLEFVEDIVIQHENQTIYGDVKFQGSLRGNSSLTLNGTLNGLDLEDFNTSVHKISDEEFTGSLHFADIYANDSIGVEEFVNEIDIGNDVLLKSKENQTVIGEKTFSSSLSIEKILNSSTVNGLDIEDLADSILKNIGDQIVTGYYKFWEGITLDSNMTLGGLIDGVDIVELANRIWRTDYIGDITELVVTGNGTFNLLNTHQEIYYNGTLDGVDLRELNRTYVSLTEDQVITGSKQFLEKVVIDESSNLRTPYIEVEGTVEGLDLEDISDHALISGNSGQEVSGVLTFLENVTFEADVDVDGTVDGISISSNVMRTHKTNIVRAHKNFTYPLIEIASSLSMQNGKKVQEVDVSEWKQQSADTLNNYLIDYDTRFAEVIVLENLNVDGLLNGVNYSTEYLLTIPHDQTVYGDLTFFTDTVFEGDMTATTINGLDMVDLATNTLFTTGEQTIAGSLTLASETFFNHITTHGKLGGVSVPDFWRRIHIYPELDSFEKIIQEQCGVLDELYNSQQNGAVIFRGLEPIQVEVSVGDVLWVPYRSEGEQWVALSVSPVYDNYRGVVHPDTCGHVLLKKWNASNWQYQDEVRITFDVIKDMRFFEADNVTGFVIAEQTLGKGCEDITNLTDYITELPTAGPAGIPLTGSFWVHVILTDNVTTYHQRLLGVGTSTVDIFKTPFDEICVFVGNMYDSVTFTSAIDSFIYCTTNLSDGFTLSSAVPTFGVSKVTLFTFNGLTHIMVGNRLNSVEQTFHVNSSLWVYDQGVATAVDSIPTKAVADVVTGIVNGQLLLVFVNEFTGGWMHEDFRQSVDIYRFSQDGIESYQKIDTFGAKSAIFFTLERLDFLAILDRNELVKIYKYEGIMQFEEHYSVHIQGAAGLWVDYLPTTSTAQIFVATYQGEVNLFPWQPSRPVASPSQIFEVVSSGEIYPSIGCTVE